MRYAAAVEGENEVIEDRSRRRSLERYYDLGLFGPNLYLVHMGYPNDREIDGLKQHGREGVAAPSAASMHGAYGVVGNQMTKKMIDRNLDDLARDRSSDRRLLPGYGARACVSRPAPIVTSSQTPPSRGL